MGSKKKAPKATTRKITRKKFEVKDWEPTVVQLQNYLDSLSDDMKTRIIRYLTRAPVLPALGDIKMTSPHL